MSVAFSGRKIAVLSAFFSLAVSCFGASINVASSATETTNNSGSPTLSLAAAPDPNWASPLTGSSWISYVNSGNPALPGFVSPPNGTSVTFSDIFFLNGTPLGGSVQVLADDTSSVLLNGVSLMTFAPTGGNTYMVCSDYVVGCSTATTASLNLAGFLQPGTNTLSFVVQQLNGVAYGLDYSGQIQYIPSGTSAPEPAEWGFLSLSLLIFALIRSR